MFEKEELKPIDPSKYKITETGQVLKMTKEELEREKCELLGIVQGKDKVIQELEKENAELKEQVENPQLTKAKEIIKDFILMAKVERLKDRYETVDEAEQFIRE